MSTGVVTVKSEEPVSKAISRLVKNDVGSVVVMDEHDNAVGIVTKGDILKKIVLERGNPDEIPTEKVMSRPVITIQSGPTIEEASKLMTQRKVSKLPVVDGEKLVGIITSTDIIRAEPMEVGYLQELVRARFVPHDLR